MMGMLALLATTSLPAQTGVARADPAQQYAAAARALAQRIDNRPATGAMPRTSDAQVAALIAIVSDGARRFGTPAFPVRGLDSYRAVCTAPGVIARQYATFGLDRRLAANTDPAQRARITAAVVDANTRAYQNEILPLLRFSLRCNALHVPVLEAALPAAAADPQRRRAMVSARAAIAQSMRGSLQTVAMPGIRADNGAMMLRGLAESAPVLTRMLALPQRADLARLNARYLAAAPPALRPDLQRIGAALAARECIGLCRLA